MAIPAPELIGEKVTAALLQIDQHVILAIGPLPPELPQGVTLLRPNGPLVLRYGLAYLQRELCIVPGLFAAEYGAILVGREAWDYTLQHSNLHPRADVLGLRCDGQNDQVMLRELDFGRSITVLAYETEDARLPLATLEACWIAAPSTDLPELLVAYLPLLDHLAPAE